MKIIFFSSAKSDMCAIICIMRIFFCVHVYASATAEYLYPVAFFKDKDHGLQVYLIYQRSCDGLELLLWDPVTKIAQKALSSAYTPGSMALLPDGSGFSFIDQQGRIRVKSFKKRSPKSIALYEPVDDINKIDWINNTTFYFMGKFAQKCALFQATMAGEVHALVKADNTDFLYPQKQNDVLFFITRTTEGAYTIATTMYPAISYDEHDTFNETENFHERVVTLLHEEAEPLRSLRKIEEIETVIDLGHSPAAFLSMSSENEGFYIEHPATIARTDSCVPFSYWHFKKEGAGWIKKQLFSFVLPAHYFLHASPTRLYESLLPLLPRRTAKNIYFVHCYDAQRLRTGIFKYDCQTAQCQRISLQEQTTTSEFFGPLVISDGLILYGGAMHSEDLNTGDRVPALWIDEQNRICIDIPMAIAPVAVQALPVQPVVIQPQPAAIVKPS